MTSVSFGIMDSEEAVQWKRNILETVGMKDSTDSVPAELLMLHFPDIFETIAGAGQLPDTYNQAVGFQVLATLMLDAGCELTAKQKVMLANGVVCCSEYQAIKQLELSAPGRVLTESFMTEFSQKIKTPLFVAMLPRYLARIAAIETLHSKIYPIPF